MGKKKEKIVVIGNHKPTWSKGEYKKKCCRCGGDVYLLCDWSDKDAEFMCLKCALEINAFKKAKIYKRAIEKFKEVLVEEMEKTFAEGIIEVGG